VVGVRRSARRRALLVGVVLSVAGFAVFCVSISVGEFPIPLADVVPAVVGYGNPDSDFIIRTLRLPRALGAVEVGAAFGMSGAILQALARNPLASPDIIGITAGASASAVFVIVVLAGTALMVSVGALIGALLTAMAIYLLAYKRGISSYRLVLVGIGLGAMLESVTSYLLTRAEIYDAREATVWLTGSLNGLTWNQLRPLTVSLVVLVPAAIWLVRPLRMLLLGDDTAKGLGVWVEPSRGALLLVSVGLAAVATATAGPVAFVAFLAAPIARRLTDSPLAVVTAGLAGAVLLLVADVLSRVVLPSTDLPVGIVTGIVGAPYLLWLLARSNRIGRGG
jgi:iron complex transport system permease protein